MSIAVKSVSAGRWRDCQEYQEGNRISQNSRKEEIGMGEKKEKKVTRRDFIKKAGKGAAALGIASMVPKFARPAKAASRDYVLIGWPNSTTGPRAGFGEPTPWADDRVLKYVNEKEGGIFIKEYGKKVPVQHKVLDDESSPTKAGEITSRLILHDKVDLMVAFQMPEAIAAFCERNEVPCLIMATPVEMWKSGGPYKWSYHAGISFKAGNEAYMGMWEANANRTNMTFGMMAPNDADGIAFAKLWEGIIKEKGWKVVDPGRFPSGVQDWTSVIKQLKEGNVEILMGSMAPPDFAALWRQMHQQGFLPKICSVGRANLFPSAVNALGGELGNGICVDIHWSPQYPFKSPLTGETPRQVADAWEKENNKIWTQVVGFKYTGMELAIDILKRAQSIDKNKILEAMANTNADTLWGRIKFDKDHHCLRPVVVGQWVKGKKWPYEPVIINTKMFPEVPVAAEMIFPVPGYKKS
jgi:branched-chain amino acid transport system substrate-binding protein